MSSIAKIRKNFQEFEKLYILFCDTKPLPAYYIKFHAVMKGMKQIGSNTTDPEIVEFRKKKALVKYYSAGQEEAVQGWVNKKSLKKIKKL